jgi:DNA helicase II / ATP-dependent DNA helicase PcrA
MSSLLEGLNDKQKQAVTHFEGPLLVVAGAGSGKTSALTNRIAYLIKERGVSPWNVLAVTFTNKAAKEMKERVVKLLANEDSLALLEGFEDILDPSLLVDEKNLPTIGTFHSVCVRILRKNIHHLDYENSFAIYDYADQQVLVKRIMQDLAIDVKKINPKAVLSHISNAKNQLLAPMDYGQYASDQFSEMVARIYPKYQSALCRNNALDFDDIIMKTVELFQGFSDILDYYQEKFKFISVDEYQDTNKAQYELISLLAGKYNNLCVIGDSDQSIYSWRGATIQNILDFEKDNPTALIVKLEQNYRSTQMILDAANTIISKNLNRQDKRLWTEKKGGDKIRHWLADNERHEGQLIAREIENQLIGSEYPHYKDFVVLYRTNAQSRTIEEVLIGHGIPYKIIGGTKFYERKEIKDILAYLRVLTNPNDSVSLLRIVNTPSRKIGAKTLECVRSFALRNNLSLFNAMLLADEIEELPKTKAQAIEVFVKLIKNLQNENASAVASSMIRLALNQSGYKKLLNDGSVEGEARLENISELVSVAKKYDKLEPAMSLKIFLEEVSLIADIDSLDETDNAVTLMTVHGAKGLEFPNVFIAGLEEGIFPHNRSLLDREELEEERRLMYVAMTRAKENLFLLHSRRRLLYGEARSNAPSQFLADIDESLVESNFGGHGARVHMSVADIGRTPIPVEFNDSVGSEFSAGDKVNHNVFGRGIIVDITGGVATVAFEDSKVGVKKLALSVAPLKKV